jgi:heme-degrading monooxygenase HmoA
MYARVTTIESDPAIRDAVAAAIKATVIPQVSAMPGFVAGYWLCSPDGNKSMSITMFDTFDALERWDNEAKNLRQQAGEVTTSTVHAVNVFEVVATA